MSGKRLLVYLRSFLTANTLMIFAIGIPLLNSTIYMPVIFDHSFVTAPIAYWGAVIDASNYGLPTQPPESMDAVTRFESDAGKGVSILHWEQRWQSTPGQDNPFSAQDFNNVRQHGALPLIDWLSEDGTQATPDSNRPQFALSHIINGSYDAYIRQWAADAKAWGHPFFLRFDYEMNGNWLAWSESANGNHAGQYVLAWRHVHNIFTQVGATNVTWVWCPNILIPPDTTTPINELYPGDRFVDWTCLDGYNWGTNPIRDGRWQTFTDLFQSSYAEVLSIAPSKPMMIAESASSEYGGSKPDWITNVFTDELPNAFPQVKAFVWFNVNKGGMDWVIESTPASQSAFTAAIASDYYASNQYANFDQSPIPPP